MKQTLAVFLLSVGIYSFTFGLYVTVKWMEMERNDRLRNITDPGSKAPARVERSPIRQHPLGLLMLCATGMTISLAGSAHFLLQDKTAKRKRTAGHR